MESGNKVYKKPVKQVKPVEQQINELYNKVRKQSIEIDALNGSLEAIKQHVNYGVYKTINDKRSWLESLKKWLKIGNK